MNLPSLSHTALAFAKEVMGWESPKLDGSFVCSVDGDRYLWFPYADLAQVMKAVAAWSGDPAILDLELRIGAEYCASVAFALEKGLKPISVTSADPCHALMLVCVAAALKLQGAV